MRQPLCLQAVGLQAAAYELPPIPPPPPSPPGWLTLRADLAFWLQQEFLAKLASLPQPAAVSAEQAACSDGCPPLSPSAKRAGLAMQAAETVPQ